MQRGPRALALGPIPRLANTLAGGEQRGGGLLEQQWHGLVAVHLGQAQCMGEAFRRGHHEARRMDEGEQLQEIEPEQIGIAEAAGYQRRAQHQDRHIGGGADRFAFGYDLGGCVCSAGRLAAQPAAGMAGVEGGQIQRGRIWGIRRGRGLWGHGA